MKLNKKLTAYEKLKIFKNIPLATVGAYTFIIGLSLIMGVVIQKPFTILGFNGLATLSVFLITVYFLLNHSYQS